MLVVCVLLGECTRTADAPNIDAPDEITLAPEAEAVIESETLSDSVVIDAPGTPESSLEETYDELVAEGNVRIAPPPSWKTPIPLPGECCGGKNPEPFGIYTSKKELLFSHDLSGHMFELPFWASTPCNETTPAVCKVHYDFTWDVPIDLDGPRVQDFTLGFGIRDPATGRYGERHFLYRVQCPSWEPALCSNKCWCFR